MACHRIPSCALFTTLKTSVALSVWTSLYCEGRFERCERLKLSQAGRPVPQNLLPNGRLIEQALPTGELTPE